MTNLHQVNIENILRLIISNVKKFPCFFLLPSIIHTGRKICWNILYIHPHQQFSFKSGTAVSRRSTVSFCLSLRSVKTILYKCFPHLKTWNIVANTGLCNHLAQIYSSRLISLKWAVFQCFVERWYFTNKTLTFMKMNETLKTLALLEQDLLSDDKTVQK